jgi:CRP-like cAMP-binding protein
MSTHAPESTPSLSAAEALAATPFFASLGTVQIARLVPELEELHFEPGQAVFCRGDEADGLYLIRSGEVEQTVASEQGTQAVRLLEAGSYFGEGALLRKGPRAANVVARTPLTVWKVPGERFEALVQEHPDLPV